MVFISKKYIFLKDTTTSKGEHMFNLKNIEATDTKTMSWMISRDIARIIICKQDMEKRIRTVDDMCISCTKKLNLTLTHFTMCSYLK